MPIAHVPHEALSSPGRPLDAGTRREMEGRFSRDFSGVRLHDDARAAAAAADIHAAAFTVGQDIAFAAGRYAPSTGRGRELLAHELAHTIQQWGAQTTAPPIPPGSALERAADNAGRAAASGQKVTSPLGVSGLAVARAPSRPAYLDAYDDEQLEDHARVMRVKLRRRSEYPDRDGDVRLLDELSTEIVRRGAVAEAVTFATRPEDEPESDEPTVVPMALSGGRKGRVEPSSRPAPRKPAPAQVPPSKFAPGGFTNEDIDRDWKESEKRLAQPKDPQPFMNRFYAARRNTPLGDAADSTEVWNVGRNEGLFTEDDRWAFERVWEQVIGRPAREEARHNATVESTHREMAWEAQGDKLVQDLQLGVIQGTLLGGVEVFGGAVATAYQAYTYVDVGVQTYRAAQSGRPEDVVGAALPLAGGLALHAATGGAGEPVPERAPVAPEPMRALPEPAPEVPVPAAAAPEPAPATPEPTAAPPEPTPDTARTESAKTQDPYRNMTPRQLRKLAKTDPEAAEALRLRYRDMSDAKLKAAARRDPMAKSVLDSRVPPNTKLPGLTGARGDKRVIPHEAEATVTDRGGQATWSRGYRSGEMTAEQEALGYPRAQQATHTEAKAIADAPLGAGERLDITGQYDPCAACRETMRLASEGGRTVTYWWPGGMFRAVNGRVTITYRP